jgi:enoyl-CoA hydratase
MGVLEQERHGAALVLRLNRPEQANSLNRELRLAIGAAFTGAAADDEVRVVVLTAAGDRIFCAGMDLKEFAAQAAAARGDGGAEGSNGEEASAGVDVLIRGGFPKPVIAAVNGAAVGGGFELVLGCDLVVAAEHARFGLPEANRGLVAAGGGTALSQRIPLALALEMALTGDPIGADRARDLGLVNRVVPAGDLLGAALELAGRVARSGPLAVAATKQLMREAIGGADWGRIREVVAPVFASGDAVEGATAFAERREPVWRGR